jgi:hypothetical protein
MFGSARIHRSGSIFERCVSIEDGPRQCWHLGADARALSFVGCWCTGLPAASLSKAVRALVDREAADPTPSLRPRSTHRF